MVSLTGACRESWLLRFLPAQGRRTPSATWNSCAQWRRRSRLYESSEGKYLFTLCLLRTRHIQCAQTNAHAVIKGELSEGGSWPKQALCVLQKWSGTSPATHPPINFWSATGTQTRNPLAPSSAYCPQLLLILSRSCFASKIISSPLTVCFLW